MPPLMQEDVRKFYEQTWKSSDRSYDREYGLIIYACGMPRWWPARRRDQPQDLTVDEVFAGRFGVGSNYSGVEVTEGVEGKA